MRKMKANELRIGNYLKYFDTIIEIDSIRKDNTYYIGGFKNHAKYYNDIDAYKPIPLTEKWLLDFGFTKVNEYLYTNDNYRIEPFVLNSVNWAFRVITSKTESYMIASIKHVHQLQNLYFALTGEELIFKK